MAAPIFCYPNLSDQPQPGIPGAVLSGGSWAMPLANLQNRRSQPARSTSTAPAATQFNMTMQGFEEIRAVVLGRHNLTVTARLRLTAWYPEQSYANPDLQIELDAYPSVAFTEDLPFEAENWWDGKPLTRSILGLTQNVPIVLPKPSFAPNWRLEIFDETNPAGFVQASRLCMATGWQPSHAMERSPTLRYETDTGVEVAMSGAEFFSVRPTYRVFNLGFKWLPKREALNKGLELMRLAGTRGELFYINDPDDALDMQQTSFFARFRTLKDYEQVIFSRASIGFELKELL